MPPALPPSAGLAGGSLRENTLAAGLAAVGRARSTGRGPTELLAPPRERPRRGRPEVCAQGRVPEVKGPCWWVTPGEVPGERRIPRSGSARSPRVSEGRSEGRWPRIGVSRSSPQGRGRRPATGSGLLAEATEPAVGEVSPLPALGIPLRGRSVAPPNLRRFPGNPHPQLWGLRPTPPGSGEQLRTRQGSAAHSLRYLVVTALA